MSKVRTFYALFESNHRRAERRMHTENDDILLIHWVTEVREKLEEEYSERFVLTNCAIYEYNKEI